MNNVEVLQWRDASGRLRSRKIYHEPTWTPPQPHPTWEQFKLWARLEGVPVHPMETLPVSPVRTRLFLIYALDRAAEALRWRIEQPAPPEIEALQPPPSPLAQAAWTSDQRRLAFAALEQHKTHYRQQLADAVAWEKVRLGQELAA